ncbi:hypothetical protein M885DRAFT_621083, partial [Pelagophyceae sp. CCMP2097]
GRRRRLRVPLRRRHHGPRRQEEGLGPAPSPEHVQHARAAGAPAEERRSRGSPRRTRSNPAPRRAGRPPIRRPHARATPSETRNPSRRATARRLIIRH